MNTKFPEVGDRVKARDGFEGKVTGFGSHAGHSTIIVEGKDGETHTYQPELLVEPKLVEDEPKAAQRIEPPTVVEKPRAHPPKPGPDVLGRTTIAEPAEPEDEPKRKGR